ncbi:MGMT family protein, partial [Alistipes finegoldii]
MRMPENFDAEVYAVVAEIPAGRVVSYKQIARLVGMPDHARRVGRALAEAPAGLPCH